MMVDVGWLSEQAKQIHSTFEALFYVFLTTLLLLGIFMEYFKWPLGGTPSFSVLIGRALIAVILLHTYPEVSNLIADTIDGLSQKLGDLNNFNLVLAKMGGKLNEMTFSWVSAKDLVTWVISFLTFFMLFISVHSINAFMLFVWTLLYCCSPLLIALFVLPSTAQATKGLYKSLIEVSLWKVVFSILSTLLWSFALSDINNQGSEISFISVVFLNLILAGSLLSTPLVVHALAGGGFSGLATSAGGLIAGATMAAPYNFFKSSKDKVKHPYQFAKSSFGFVASKLSGEKPNKKSDIDRGTKPKQSTPPKWFKSVPFPTEPPQFLKEKLEKEKNQKSKEKD